MDEKERNEWINKLKDFIDSLDDSADAEDIHKFVDTCQVNYEEGTFNEILRFMQVQEKRMQELERFKKYFDEMYGIGLEVAEWHQNGDLELFDNFYGGCS